MPQRLGKLIVLDGIDQSGKRTQTQMIARRIKGLGYRVSVWSFPDYRTPIGQQLRKYLTGRKRFDFHAVHLLYAANKWESASRIEREINRGQIVIINRYTPSNLAYGVAHGISAQWLQLLEDELPKPNLVIILDLAPKVSFKRKKRLRDVHEEDLSYLTNVRKAYIQLGRKYNWKIINANRDQSAVHLEAWRHVLPVLPQRQQALID